MFECLADQVAAAPDIAVARLMTVFVIDPLEIVHIDHNHREIVQTLCNFRVDLIDLACVRRLAADAGQLVAVRFL